MVKAQCLLRCFRNISTRTPPLGGIPNVAPALGWGQPALCSWQGAGKSIQRHLYKSLYFFFFFFFSSQIQNKLLIAVLALTLAALPASACAPLSADLRRRLLLFIYS